MDAGSRRRPGRGAFVVAALAVAVGALAGAGSAPVARAVAGGYNDVTIEEQGAKFAYVVFHALDRDGFCDAAAFGGVSLHPVLTDAPNDTMYNPATGQPNPRETVDFMIDSGDGIIVASSAGAAGGGVRAAIGVPTFSTYDNALAGSPVKAFAPRAAGAPDECQAWVKVASASSAPVNVLVTAHDDAGDLGFDRVISFAQTAVQTLSPGWTLVTWAGADGISPGDALSASGPAAGGDNILARVTAVYAWDQGTWSAFFPAGAGVAGANDLHALKQGQAYWIAISGTTPIQWHVAVPG